LSELEKQFINHLFMRLTIEPDYFKESCLIIQIFANSLLSIGFLLRRCKLSPEHYMILSKLVNQNATEAVSNDKVTTLLHNIFISISQSSRVGI